jgi:hypothetical protein
MPRLFENLREEAHKWLELEPRSASLLHDSDGIGR